VSSNPNEQYSVKNFMFLNIPVSFSGAFYLARNPYYLKQFFIVFNRVNYLDDSYLKDETDTIVHQTVQSATKMHIWRADYMMPIICDEGSIYDSGLKECKAKTLFDIQASKCIEVQFDTP